MPAPCRALFVRHGEVEAGVRRRFYGSADVALSERGIRESLALAAELGDPPPDAVWSSPLQRARLLADAIGVDVTVDADLRELDRGDWTMKSKDEVGREAIERYLADPETGNGPGGESESALAARVMAVVDRIAERHAGERVVVVSHGHVIRVVMARLLGWEVGASLSRFVPTLGRVETEIVPGKGRVLSAPEPILPPALQP